MNASYQARLFDEWAEDYDASVQRASDGFPFDGYEQVLNAITRLARPAPAMTVLDLGTGTGRLAARFAGLSCAVWGIDFSSEMLAKARERLPGATLVQADLLDLLNDWPAELCKRFDCIVSAYAFHHFDLPTRVDLLRRLARHLGDDGLSDHRHGSIVVGDIAFPTVQAREAARQRWADEWDEEEFYWAADETMAACKSARLRAQYVQVSSCGGVFVIESGYSKKTRSAKQPTRKQPTLTMSCLENGSRIFTDEHG